MQVKQITNSDIKDVVNIHIMSFENFFLTSLGKKFLTVYYNCVRKDSNGLLLGCYQDDVLIGFCAACLYSKGFNAKLISHNFLKFLWVGLQILFTKPKSLIRLFKNLTKKDPNINDNGDYSELLSIAVNPNKQGLGVGQKLLNRLEQDLVAKSCSKLSLTTDYHNNEKTIHFYEGLGYKVMYEFISYPNRKMYRMIKILSQN